MWEESFKVNICSWNSTREVRPCFLMPGASAWSTNSQQELCQLPICSNKAIPLLTSIILSVFCNHKGDTACMDMDVHICYSFAVSTDAWGDQDVKSVLQKAGPHL